MGSFQLNKAGSEQEKEYSCRTSTLILNILILKQEQSEAI